MKKITLKVALILSALAFAATSWGGVISVDTTWMGEVYVDDDIRVLPGVTLTIAPGARVKFAQALSTKTEPAYWSPETELSVEGVLMIEGSEREPVALIPDEESWGGIVVAPGGRAALSYTRIERALEGVLVAGGDASLNHTQFNNCDYGLVAGPGSMLDASAVTINHPKVGVVDMRENAQYLPGVEIQLAEDAERLYFVGERAMLPEPPSLAEPIGGSRELLGEYTVEGDESWGGEVIITGRVTVPPGSTLTIMEGTRVSFRKHDTNGDGLGEGEILVTGGIRVLGTDDAPVIFQSAEEAPLPGDWDKLSIISSMDDGNVVRNAIFRDGLQALHAHFSSLAVDTVYFTNNIRALQFQESERTTVRGSTFAGNKQAVRFRDSDVEISGCLFEGNDYTLHGFRADIHFKDNRVYDTRLGGILAKESTLSMSGNVIAGGRIGVRARGEGTTLALRGNSIIGTVETGLSTSYIDGATLLTNEIKGAGLDLIGVEASSMSLEGNTLGDFGRHAIHLKAGAEVSLKENVWDIKIPIDDAIFDEHDPGGREEF